MLGPKLPGPWSVGTIEKASGRRAGPGREKGTDPARRPQWPRVWNWLTELQLVINLKRCFLYQYCFFFSVWRVAAEVFTSCGRVDNYSRREKNLGYKCRKSQIRSEPVSVQGNIEIYCMACARSRYNACSDWLILLSGARENKAKSHIINTFLTLIVLSYGKISNLGLAVSFGQYYKVSLWDFPVKIEQSR